MTVRVGVLGAGYWGSTLLRGLHEVPGAQVVSAWDTAPDRLEAAVRRYPSVRPAASLTGFMSDPAIDAVVIATSASSHAELTSAALRAGKHVFVEKPFALSSLDAVELVRQADDRGLVLFPGHTFLYSPAVVAIRELIDSGSLGEVLVVSAERVNLGLHRSDVNVVWDLGVHDLSILQYWLGESPTHVGAIGRSCVPGHEADVAFINLEYASGAVAHLELSWIAPTKRRRTTVVGTRKMVEYVDGDDAPVRIFDAGAEPGKQEGSTVDYRNGDPVMPCLSDAEPIVLQLTDFCDAVEHGATPRSTGELGIEVLRVLEAVDASLAARDRRVEVPVA